MSKKDLAKLLDEEANVSIYFVYSIDLRKELMDVGNIGSAQSHGHVHTVNLPFSVDFYSAHIPLWNKAVLLAEISFLEWVVSAHADKYLTMWTAHLHDVNGPMISEYRTFISCTKN